MCRSPSMSHYSYDISIKLVQSQNTCFQASLASLIKMFHRLSSREIKKIFNHVLERLAPQYQQTSHYWQLDFNVFDDERASTAWCTLCFTIPEIIIKGLAGLAHLSGSFILTKYIYIYCMFGPYLLHYIYIYSLFAFKWDIIQVWITLRWVCG